MTRRRSRQGLGLVGRAGVQCDSDRLDIGPESLPPRKGIQSLIEFIRGDGIITICVTRGHIHHGTARSLRYLTEKYAGMYQAVPADAETL